MIETLRQIKSRIKGAQNIEKITRAMEMVSAAKLNRVKKALYAHRPYSNSLEEMSMRLIADTGQGSHPLTKEPEKSDSIALCVVASDTGLCGNYNYNILRLAEDFILKNSGKRMLLITVGKEAFSYFKKRGLTVGEDHSGSYGRYSEAACDTVTNVMIDMFSSKKADEVYIAYTRFASALKQVPTVEKFLNIGACGAGSHNYIIEPDEPSLLDELLPAYLLNKMRTIVMEAFTSEHTARMFAMKTATDNADDMIDTLTLMRNKARQFAITKEVLEIAMSAEALKGQ